MGPGFAGGLQWVDMDSELGPKLDPLDPKSFQGLQDPGASGSFWIWGP